jgi:hypothetical protein
LSVFALQSYTPVTLQVETDAAIAAGDAVEDEAERQA